MPTQQQEIHLHLIFFYYFMFFCFSCTISNRPDVFRDSTILKIQSISLFEMNKFNPFPVLSTHLLLIFFSNLSNTDKVALVANLSETYLPIPLANNLIIIFFLKDSAYYLKFYQEIHLIELFQSIDISYFLCTSTYCQPRHFLFWLLVLLFKIIHETILHLEGSSQLFFLLFGCYILLQILIFLDALLLFNSCLIIICHLL